MDAPTTEVIHIPDKLVGAVIGSGGSTVNEVKRATGAHVQIDAEKTDPRRVVVTGSAIGVAQAVAMIHEIISQVPGAGFSRVASWDPSGGDRAEPVVFEVPHHRAGIVIGRGGETIRDIMQRSGAHVQVSREPNLPAGAPETRSIHIQGSKEQVEMASQMVRAKLFPGDAYRQSQLPMLRQGSGSASASSAHAAHAGGGADLRSPAAPKMDRGDRRASARAAARREGSGGWHRGMAPRERPVGRRKQTPARGPIYTPNWSNAQAHLAQTARGRGGARRQQGDNRATTQ